MYTYKYRYNNYIIPKAHPKPYSEPNHNLGML